MAHASVATTYANWKALRDPDTVRISFAAGSSFLAHHPDWPDEKTIRLRTEAAAFLERPERTTMASFCADRPPISGRGMYACYRAGAGDADTRTRWLHQGWIRGDFTDDEEAKILRDYGKDLTRADHTARMERLLYEHKTNQAKRLMGLMPANRQTIYKVWLSLAQNDRRAKAELNRLSAADQREPGILYERAKAAQAAGKSDMRDTLVYSAPGNAPYPELWWPLRNIAIRDMLGKRATANALHILANRGELDGEPLAEALWLKGWITLTYTHEPAAAYKDFRALYIAVSTPVSLARAAYWAGRAAEMNGNHDIARSWYEKAARFPITFYGQLAHTHLTPHTPLDLPDQPVIAETARQSFEQDEQVAVVRMLTDQGDIDMRDHFLSHMAAHADEAGFLSQLADLAQKTGGTARGVRIAKQALRKQVILISRGWPEIGLPANIGVERPLALAISRQESEFDPHAKSQANARGLMQLLPDTARHIAKQNDIPYSPAKLEDPTTNLTLGTTYLGRLVRGFNGSYILGIASYNAGPSTVRGWIATFGAPPKNPDGAVQWIESIPYGETRNYVMRVLENTQVYRTLADSDSEPALLTDLTR